LKKRKVWAVATVCATVGGLLGGFAIAGANLSGSTFEGNDGNIVANGGVDWANLVASGGTLSVGTDQPTGQNDNSFTQGSKEDDTNVVIGLGSIPNNKADIGKFGVGTQVPTSGARSGHTIMDLAWIRNNDGGTTNFDFEINQAAQPNMLISAGQPDRAVQLNRTGDGAGPLVDDLLITYDLQGGASNPTLSFRKWGGSAWGAAQPITSADSEGKINCITSSACSNGAGAITQANSGPFNQAIAATRFGEADIDLTALGILPNQNDPNAPCVSFGSAYVKSRSSSSFTAQMKDYSAPIGIGLDTCGSITVNKITDPSPDPTATTFNYTRSGPGTAYDAPFTLVDGGSNHVGNLTPGVYTVSETDPGPNFALQSLTCQDPNGNTVVSGATATITLDAKEDVVCTYTNHLQRGHIVVNKVAERPNVSFHFNASYNATGFDLADGGSNDSGELLPGQYNVSENVLPGWNNSSATCDHGNLVTAINLLPDETVTCTFTNVIERGAVAVHKVAKDAAAGGTKPVAGVSFVVTNATNGTSTTITTDASGNACVAGLPVSVLDGDYNIHELVPPGYAPVADQSFTVVEGDCGTAIPAQVVNIPLTDIHVQVDSQVDGGTASTIDCGAGTVHTGANGDGSTDRLNLQPGTYTCTVVIDP